MIANAYVCSSASYLHPCPSAFLLFWFVVSFGFFFFSCFRLPSLCWISFLLLFSVLTFVHIYQHIVIGVCKSSSSQQLPILYGINYKRCCSFLQSVVPIGKSFFLSQQEIKWKHKKENLHMFTRKVVTAEGGAAEIFCCIDFLCTTAWMDLDHRSTIESPTLPPKKTEVIIFSSERNRLRSFLMFRLIFFVCALKCSQFHSFLFFLEVQAHLNSITFYDLHII